jgi:hypothetical protein
MRAEAARNPSRYRDLHEYRRKVSLAAAASAVALFGVLLVIGRVATRGAQWLSVVVLAGWAVGTAYVSFFYLDW